MFDYTAIGLLSLLAIAFLSIGWRPLPDSDGDRSVKRFAKTCAGLLPDGSPMVGKSVSLANYASSAVVRRSEVTSMLALSAHHRVVGGDGRHRLHLVAVQVGSSRPLVDGGVGASAGNHRQTIGQQVGSPLATG
jgi:hypothetical protein